ncbi:MAG: HD domain-containing protein [Thermodesulfobacteriota bacterium]
MNGAERKTFVEDIREGQEVDSPFLLDELRLGQTKTGRPFVGLKLRDRTGQIEGRVWDQAEEFYRVFRNGDVALVRGAAESFQGQVQLKVLEARGLDPSQVDQGWFLPSSRYDPEEMLAELTALLGTINDPHLAGLAQDFLADETFRSSFRTAPAAKRFHHAYRGGLLEHTLSLTRTATAVAPLYPALNRDLLLAGAFLHDVGKVREFGEGLSGDYTDEGRLLGHLLIGLEMVEEKISGRPDFPSDLALLVKHLVVSHHGENEMGSPKTPAILEALALHLLDDLDAKMNGIGGFIERHADAGTGWTDYNRLLERFFFRPAYQSPSPPVSEAPGPTAAEETKDERTRTDRGGRKSGKAAAREAGTGPDLLDRLED